MSGYLLTAGALDDLIGLLAGDDYEVVGPTLQDGAILYDRISSAGDLPRGKTDEQAPGHYRVKEREDGAYFGYAVGPHSFKKYFHPAQVSLFRAERSGGRFRILDNEAPPAPQRALLGARACEIAAIHVQDRVLDVGALKDPGYGERREGTFVVALNCGVAGGTCFCASMGTGPKATAGFDLALTELLEGEHRFLVEAGSDLGEEVVARLGLPEADETDEKAAEAVVEGCASSMGRTLETTGIVPLLYENREHPRWDDVAERCLACANCTMVCPTCFCTTVVDLTDLTGEHTERKRVWDSCFNSDFSYIHGGVVRPTIRGRYRQWLTHKVASWYDQFGTSGCVGCGRCITWCPVGIDITEEVAAIRASNEEQ